MPPFVAFAPCLFWDRFEMLLRLFALITVILCFAPMASAETFTGSGIKKLVVIDPVDNKPMDAVVFYPSTDEAIVTKMGPYNVAASPKSPMAEGQFPLILLSHGTMGSMWGHHDLGASLARNGYIVISLTHAGDNFADTSRLGAVSSTYGRPMQISAALSTALDDAALAPHIDKNRIGFVGFSAGGTTGLILAGAKPDLSRFEAYCAKRPDDHSVCEAEGKIRTDRPDLAPQADPRISAYVLMAPLSVIFGAETLKSVTAPTLIYVGDQDGELSPQENAMALAPELPKAQLQVIEKAGHFTFLAPCSEELTKLVAGFCIDNPGIVRTALHQRMNAEIATFFEKNLEKLN